MEQWNTILCSKVVALTLNIILKSIIFTTTIAIDNMQLFWCQYIYECLYVGVCGCKDCVCVGASMGFSRDIVRKVNRLIVMHNKF